MATGTALVRRPGPRLADGIVTHIERVPVDLELAQLQWQGYADAMASNGWDLIEVPPADDCPDAVFVEDTVVMFGTLAVITRPGADARKPETVDVEQVVESLGCSIARIERPGTLDGGDVLKVGDTVYVGRGGRTNADGIAQLRAILATARSIGRGRTAHEGAAPQVGRDRASRRFGHRLPAAGRRPRASSPASSPCPRSPAPMSSCSAGRGC